MLSKIVTVSFFVFMGISSMIMFVPAVIIWLTTYPFDKRKAILHLFTCFWGAMYTRVVPSWKIKIYGRNNFRNGVTYVIVSNHQSQLDILVSLNLFKHFKWVSKSEVFRIPFIGWNMYLNNYIGLVRGNMNSVNRMMDDCEKTLRRGSSVFLFPEGTRSQDGRVKVFKPGAFMLAHKLKLPILPVAISGTSEALPKYSMNIEGIHNITLNVLEEIPYPKYSSLSITETAEMVRKMIIDHVEDNSAAS